ncbi:MAG: hypothetical protein ACI4NB_08670 [Candidatus Ornithospirochaeta sp.]
MKISKYNFSMFALFLLLVNSCLFASLKTSSARIIGKGIVSLGSIYDSTSSKSIIKPSTLNKVRGDFGEALTDLDYFSRLNGNWQIITPRQGSQGLDHIYIEFEKGTLPIGCIIADTKVNSSKLGMVENWTVTQMSYKWRTDRVKTIVQQYDELLSDLNEKKIKYKSPSEIDVIDASYPISKNSYYWKDTDGNLFLHDGGDFNDVTTQTKKMRDYLDGVARGAITSRNRLIHYSLSSSGNITESVYELIDEGETAVIQGKLLEQRTISGKAAKEVIENNKDIMTTLSTKYGLSKRKLKLLNLSGNEYVEMLNYTGRGKMPSVVKKVYVFSFEETFGFSAFLGITLDFINQLRNNNWSFEAINPKELIYSGLSAGVSATAFKLGRIVSDKIATKLFKETAKTVSSEASETVIKKFFKKRVKQGLSSFTDFGVGFMIDGVGIGYNWITGQINDYAFVESIKRAALVNLLPEFAGSVLSFIPVAGPFVGIFADIFLSYSLEKHVPKVTNLSPSVLYAEINDDPDIYMDWISNTYTNHTTTIIDYT